MGTRERRQRDLAEREQAFKAAALKQITEQGLLSLQMAKVARDCDYATGTLYQHFTSKEDLLLAICADQVEQRASVLQRAVDWQAASRDRMFAFIVGDMLCACDNPDQFRLSQYAFTEVVWQAASEERRAELLTAHQPLGRMVSRILEDAIAAGDLESHDRAPLELAIGHWCMTLGMHNLVHAEGLLPFFSLHAPYKMLLRHVQLHMNALSWRPLFDDPFNEQPLADRIENICNTLFSDLCSVNASQPND